MIEINSKKENLEYIFDNINNHLRFAEAKNAAIVTASFALITVYLFYESRFHNKFLEVFQINFIVFITFSLICSLLSYYSKITIIGNLNKKDNFDDASCNIIFFGDIAYMDEDQYCQTFFDVPLKNLDDNYCSCLINQIVINSRITKRKFEMFNLSLWFFIAACLSPVGAYLLVNMLSDRKV
jgi:hypothetical protein